MRLNLNTPPQAGTYRSKAPNLSHIYFILRPLRNLVKISASWSFELTKLVIMQSRCNILFDKVAIHFDVFGPLMEKTGLDEMCKVT